MSVTVRLPLKLPGALGAYFTLMVQLSPWAMTRGFLGQLSFLVTAAGTVMLWILRSALPLLVNSTAIVGLSPTLTVPKATLV